jgi:hypothetical protein
VNFLFQSVAENVSVWKADVMKFTDERVALERMVGQLKAERGAKGLRQRMLRLSACAARVFVEANDVVAGIEALVLEEGACNVPRMKFLKVLRTFHPKPNITVTADAGGLRIESFLMKVTCFSPVATVPGEFQVFPVTDTWLAQPETPKSAPPESHWLKSRWWE